MIGFIIIIALMETFSSSIEKKGIKMRNTVPLFLDVEKL